MNNSLIRKSECNQFPQANSSITNAINLILEKSIQFSDSETCSYAFKNAMIQILSMNQLSSSLIRRSLLVFQNLSINSLNSYIYSVKFIFYHADFNTRLLNEYVFANTSLLQISGIVNSIQLDMFNRWSSILHWRRYLFFFKDFCMKTLFCHC